MRVSSKRLSALAAAIVVAALAACAPDSDDRVDEAITTTATTAATAPAVGGPNTPARASSGCSSPDQAFAATIDGTILSRGVERRYKLFAPPDGGQEPRSLVLNIHGLASDMDLFAEMNQLGRLAVAEGFVAVYGQALGDPPSWNADPVGDDVAYLNDLLDAVEAKLCIDTAREYVTGFSQGAVMTTLLACVESERFAAAAPVASVVELDDCEASEPVPAIAFHGTEDPFVPFEGGLRGIDGRPVQPREGVSAERPVVERVAAWAARNGCGSDSTESSPAVGARLLTSDCPPGSEVGLYILDGAGHTWPGSTAVNPLAGIFGPTNPNVDATAVMWEFFQQHARP